MAELAESLTAGAPHGPVASLARRAADVAEQAESLMMNLADAHRFDHGLANLTQSLAASGHLRHAEDAATLIRDPSARARAFIGIAQQCHDNAASGAANASHARPGSAHDDPAHYALAAYDSLALTASPIGKRDDPRSDALSALITSLIGWGLLDEAEEIARTSRYLRKAHEDDLLKVATALAGDGHLARARRVTGELMTQQQVEGLLAIARSPDILPGDLDTTLVGVPPLLARVADGKQRVRLQRQFVDLLTAQGRTQDAREYIARITDLPQLAIARLLLTTYDGEDNEALALAGSTDDPLSRAENYTMLLRRAARPRPQRSISPPERLLLRVRTAIQDVVSCTVRAGAWRALAEALQAGGWPGEAGQAWQAAVAGLPPGPAQDAALAAWAGALAATGDIDGAMSQLARITSPRRRSSELITLACHLGTADGSQAAVTAAQLALDAACRIREPGAGDDLLLRLIPILIDVGDAPAARDAAGKVQIRSAQAPAWGQLALAHAARRHTSRAEHIVRHQVQPAIGQMPDPSRQAELLGQLAYALRHGRSDLPHTLLAHALATSRWGDCLPAIGVLAPQALLTVLPRLEVLVPE